MAFWGLVLVAVGVGSLLNVDIWPLIAIVVGVGFFTRAASGRSGRGNTMWGWSCWPTFYREPEQVANRDERDVRDVSL